MVILSMRKNPMRLPVWYHGAENLSYGSNENFKDNTVHLLVWGIKI